eukprot:CAMPEP_0201615962 /NCGR_PEP_ID=MMETSP0492-20130828/32691_1 /ASSEMBLY_ACC=CAM_ASM_000837 /TAXON_ID=420259 /ORGANISM="Thalassiosira gravida, Strain GMp14c1" /LENGTH=266 /DNA_ID=CAMNT_0048083793 /DNA_START=26 /DNA_END=826 /DNA_ORIENTATION=-
MTRSRSDPDRALASSENNGGDRDFTPDVGLGGGVNNNSQNVMALRGGGIDNINNVELKSYASEASSLFGNLRVPASLFAGASVGAAFAMPIGGPEGLTIGLVKRIYALLMISSLACQTVVVVVSTCTMGALALGAVEKTKSVGDLLELDYSLEWITARFFFLTGTGCFSVGSGIRAWITIGCPIFARASLGMIISATLLSFAFVRDTSRHGKDKLLHKLPVKFVKLLIQKAKKDWMFALSLLVYSITWTYIIVNAPHVWMWLAAGN